MDAISFVKNYLNYIDEIGNVVKPELKPILDELRELDPHDLIRPDTFFTGENQAKGFVWGMFLKRVSKSKSLEK